MIVKAQVVDDIDCPECDGDGCKACRDTGYRAAGSLQFCETFEPRVDHIFYVCPCGCGVARAIPVRIASEDPGDGPEWLWDENREAPTLSPSVNILSSYGRDSHWHGWLRNGQWVSA